MECSRGVRIYKECPSPWTRYSQREHTRGPAENFKFHANGENVPFGRILFGRPSTFLLAPVEAGLTGTQATAVRSRPDSETVLSQKLAKEADLCSPALPPLLNLFEPESNL